MPTMFGCLTAARNCRSATAAAAAPSSAALSRPLSTPRRRPGRDDRYRRRLEPAAVAEPAVDRPAAARLPAHHPVHRPSGGERQLFTTETQRAQSRQKRNGIVGELKSSLSSLSLCPLCG